jgi:hypothetical protein
MNESKSEEADKVRGRMSEEDEERPKERRGKAIQRTEKKEVRQSQLPGVRIKRT